MNKRLLIKRLGQTFTHLPEAQLQHMTNSILALLGEALVQGERIEIRGFGSFSCKSYAPYLAHIPVTGSYMMTKARVRATFKASSLLKARLNAAPTE